MTERIAFIGGGNMASAIIGGLIRQGTTTEAIDVVEPSAEARAALHRQHGVAAQAQAGDWWYGPSSLRCSKRLRNRCGPIPCAPCT